MTSTRRLARVLLAGCPAVEVAALDLTLQRAAGASLRRWRHRRPSSVARQRTYAEAATRLDGPREPSTATLLFLGRLDAALAPPSVSPC